MRPVNFEPTMAVINGEALAAGIRINF